VYIALIIDVFFFVEVSCLLSLFSHNESMNTKVYMRVQKCWDTLGLVEHKLNRITGGWKIWRSERRQDSRVGLFNRARAQVISCLLVSAAVRIQPQDTKFVLDQRVHVHISKDYGKFVISCIEWYENILTGIWRSSLLQFTIPSNGGNVANEIIKRLNYGCLFAFLWIIRVHKSCYVSNGEVWKENASGKVDMISRDDVGGYVFPGSFYVH
jgi:hypothetical protein